MKAGTWWGLCGRAGGEGEGEGEGHLVVGRGGQML